MLETLKMTPFGALHTVISLIAVGAGLAALLRNKDLSEVGGRKGLRRRDDPHLSDRPGNFSPRRVRPSPCACDHHALRARRRDRGRDYNSVRRGVAVRRDDQLFDDVFLSHDSPRQRNGNPVSAGSSPGDGPGGRPRYRRRPGYCFSCSSPVHFCKCAGCEPRTEGRPRSADTGRFCDERTTTNAGRTDLRTDSPDHAGDARSGSMRTPQVVICGFGSGWLPRMQPGCREATGLLRRPLRSAIQAATP